MIKTRINVTIDQDVYLYLKQKEVVISTFFNDVAKARMLTETDKDPIKALEEDISSLETKKQDLNSEIVAKKTLLNSLQGEQEQERLKKNEQLVDSIKASGILAELIK